MFDRSWSSLSAIAAIAVVPLAIVYSGSEPDRTQSAHIALSAKPVHIGVEVATVMRPLDLDALTSADFGDSDHSR